MSATTNNHNNSIKMRIASAIAKHGPTLAGKAVFPLAYIAVGAFWAIIIVACLALGDAFVGMIPARGESTGILATLAVYGVIAWALWRHMPAQADKVFSWFPAVQAARREKAIRKAKAKCPCHSCPAQCRQEKEE